LSLEIWHQLDLEMVNLVHSFNVLFLGKPAPER